jgi:hypothetical protein
MNAHEKGIQQAAEYGRQMGLKDVALLNKNCQNVKKEKNINKKGKAT